MTEYLIIILIYIINYLIIINKKSFFFKIKINFHFFVNKIFISKLKKIWLHINTLFAILLRQIKVKKMNTKTLNHNNKKKAKKLIKLDHRSIFIFSGCYFHVLKSICEKLYNYKI